MRGKIVEGMKVGKTANFISEIVITRLNIFCALSEV